MFRASRGAQEIVQSLATVSTKPIRNQLVSRRQRQLLSIPRRAFGLPRCASFDRFLLKHFHSCCCSREPAPFALKVGLGAFASSFGDRKIIL